MAKQREPNPSAQPLTRSSESCPLCRAGILEFRERLADGQGPGWLCDNALCGYRTVEPTAKTPSFRNRRGALVERSATAHRRSMVVVARAARLKGHSKQLRENRRATRKK